MRLVIDGRRLTARRTGVGRYLEALLQEWATTGLPMAETIVALLDRAGAGRVPSVPGLRAEVVGERWPGLIWERAGLGRLLKPGDLLFAPANLVPSHWRGPTVLVIHDAIQEVLPETFPWHVRWRFGRRYRRAARRAGRILVPSAATAGDVARIHGVGPDRIRVIYQGPDPRFRPLPPDSVLVREARRSVVEGDGPYFLFVGKRSGRRNVPAILAAFAEHRRRHPSHRLVFVGPADERSTSDGVVVAGHVGEDLLHGLMAGAAALLYPSQYEGFGLPVVEAMACGCPVVTLRNSALTEAGGEAAWYLDAAGPGPLARAMHALTTDLEGRARLAALGLAQASLFSRARFAKAVKGELVAAASLARRPTRAGRSAPAGAASGSP